MEVPTTKVELLQRAAPAQGGEHLGGVLLQAVVPQGEGRDWARVEVLLEYRRAVLVGAAGGVEGEAQLRAFFQARIGGEPCKG